MRKALQARTASTPTSPARASRHNAHHARAELAGLILASLIPGPVRCGLDSQAVVSRFLHVMKYGPPKKQGEWAMTRDGDLWEIMWHICEEKGKTAVAVTKVKGHSDVLDVEQKRITSKDSQGNWGAHYAADRGADLWGSEVVAYAK
eukprot:5828105-Alexandrium_andersonii.AAC.1